MPLQLSIYCFRSLSTYSKTSVNDLSVCTMSCNVTMLICLRSLNNETATKKKEIRLIRLTVD